MSNPSENGHVDLAEAPAGIVAEQETLVDTGGNIESITLKVFSEVEDLLDHLAAHGIDGQLDIRGDEEFVVTWINPVRR